MLWAHSTFAVGARPYASFLGDDLKMVILVHVLLYKKTWTECELLQTLDSV